ncbi:hypothetical protein C1646_764614 [Rhizophagus diaphanus]|nr:hypothetical protein C1646_764614 [Rhizophagus diaphanus] [Rhizophagus sp. MUCL 43196]
MSATSCSATTSLSKTATYTNEPADGTRYLMAKSYGNQFHPKNIPNDVATIRCKISSPLGKIVQVPSALIDSGANCSVLSKGLIKLLGAEIDKNKKPPVNQDNNNCTISEDFPVMDDDKPWILLGTPWLDPILGESLISWRRGAWMGT